MSGAAGGTLGPVTGAAVRVALLMTVVAVLLVPIAPESALGATTHDPIMGMRTVSETVASGIALSAAQENADAAYDAWGRLHVVWQDGRDGNYSIMYARSDDDGHSFGPSIVVNMPRDRGNALNPAIAVDRLCNPHIAWEDPRNSATRSIDVYYARSYDGGETFGSNVRVNSDTEATSQTVPSLGVAPSGDVVVAYVSDSGTSSDVFVSASRDGGRTFQAMVKLNDDMGTNRQASPSLAMDANGSAHIAWVDFRAGGSDPDIMYAFRDSTGTISSNRRVNKDGTGNEQWAPAVAMDGGDPLVAWQDDRGGNQDIYMARRTSPSTFGPNRLVSTDAHSINQVSPDVAASALGDVHVVWEGSQGPAYAIYIANSTDGGTTFSTDVAFDPTALGTATMHRPAVAATGDSHVAVCWDNIDSSTIRGTDVMVAVRTPASRMGGRLVADDRSDAFQVRPATAIGADGTIVAVWTDNRGGGQGLRFASSPDGGATWGSRSAVGDASGGRLQLAPDIAVGPDGTAHVVWTESSVAGARVWYANNRSKVTGFNAAVRVDDSTATGFAVSPSIAAAPNGSLVVAWLDGRAGGVRVRLAQSRDTGTTWDPSVEAPGPDPSSSRGPPVVAMRDGLVVVAFTDDSGGTIAPWASSGPWVGSLGAAVRATPGSPVPEQPTTGCEVAIAMDAGPSGRVTLAFSERRGAAGQVWTALYLPVGRAFAEAVAVDATAAAGARVSPAVALGEGGTLFTAWVDTSGAEPVPYLRMSVPGLTGGTPVALPAQAGTPSSSPDLAFAAHGPAVLYVTNANSRAYVVCAQWGNSPPSPPVPVAPQDGGWVTTSTFNLTISAPSDADGDTVLVGFSLQGPEGMLLDRPFAENPRFQVNDAPSGSYTWTAVVTDGFGAFASPMWRFTVDLEPPATPALLPEPEYTAGKVNTLRWNATEDPQGGHVLYRVEASQSTEFRTPLLADSGWVDALETTFNNLPASKVYYRLSAKDEAGNLAPGAAVVNSTQDDSPPRLILFIRPPLQANQSENVEFDASSSTDDHGIALTEWDLDGDGTTDANGSVVVHAFVEAGTYNVSVALTDLAGNRKLFPSYEMTINDISAPVISITLSTGTTFPENTTVAFDASNTTDTTGISTMRWFLGNAVVPFASGKTATYRFTTPGQALVRLEARDVFGNVANATIALTVLDTTKPEAHFNTYGPFDNTKVEFFTLYVNVTDNDHVASVTLSYKTNEAAMFTDVPMEPVPGSETEWFKPELAVGGKGNATYYLRVLDASGNELRTGYQRIQVVGTDTPRPPNPDGGGGGLMDYWWLFLAIALVVVGALAVYAITSRRRRGEPGEEEGGAGPAPSAATAKAQRAAAPATAPATARSAEALAAPMGKEAAMCAIEEAYFIHVDGRLIHAAAAAEGEAGRADQDIFAGMFTAIQDFIKDSMSREGSLGSFDYGDNRVIIERGKFLMVAVTIFGQEPSALRDEIRDVVRQVEGSYAGVIERWDGDKGKLRGISEWGNKVLDLTGRIDRETVLKSKERKGVKLVSEVEFFQGFVRLKVAVKNDTDTVITDAAIDIVYDDNVLRLDHIQPVYEFKRGKVHIGNVNSGEKKTVAFNFDPVICMESLIDGNLTYRDVSGKLQVVSMKSRRADIVCPIFFTRENANTAMLKRLVREELTAQDSKVYRYPDGLAPMQAFELCKGVVHLHDVKFVREFIEPKPSWLGEAWFYGETKVKGYKIVIRVTVREASHSAEFFVASQQMEVITGLLAELGHSLNRMLKEKYMGRLKAQPIIDLKLKKDITEQPLLIEREKE